MKTRKLCRWIVAFLIVGSSLLALADDPKDIDPLRIFVEVGYLVPRGIAKCHVGGASPKSMEPLVQVLIELEEGLTLPDQVEKGDPSKAISTILDHARGYEVFGKGVNEKNKPILRLCKNGVFELLDSRFAFVFDDPTRQHELATKFEPKLDEAFSVCRALFLSDELAVKVAALTKVRRSQYELEREFIDCLTAAERTRANDLLKQCEKAINTIVDQHLDKR